MRFMIFVASTRSRVRAFDPIGRLEPFIRPKNSQLPFGRTRTKTVSHFLTTLFVKPNGHHSVDIKQDSVDCKAQEAHQVPQSAQSPFKAHKAPVDGRHEAPTKRTKRMQSTQSAALHSARFSTNLQNPRFKAHL